MEVRFFCPIKYFLLLIAALLAMGLTGCAGYHFNTSNNPLIGYDIKTISVPMFINRSVLPQLAAPLTREITLALNDYSGLKVISDGEEADAVLIGIIESSDHFNDVVRTSQTLFTDKDVAKSIGKRTSFYYPIQSAYNFKLRLIMIKRPSKEEIEMMTSELGPYVLAHPKVVLQDNIELNGSFDRVASPTLSPNDAGAVNFVKNKGIFEKSLQDTCYQAAQTFKQVVLNAF
jgi:hypothetical protein